MIPIIMNENELKLIIYGKKIEGKHIRGPRRHRARRCGRASRPRPRPTRSAPWSSCPPRRSAPDELARYAQFFSFGTNDLTQTTIGLSRDDFNSFMPDYTQFDLLEGNPFQYLNPQVRELIALAVKRGRMTRPGPRGGALRRAWGHPGQHPLLHGGGAGLRVLLAVPGAAVQAGHRADHDREEAAQVDALRQANENGREHPAVFYCARGSCRGACASDLLVPDRELLQPLDHELGSPFPPPTWDTPASLFSVAAKNFAMVSKTSGRL